MIVILKIFKIFSMKVLGSESEYFMIFLILLKLAGITSISNFWNQGCWNLVIRLKQNHLRNGCTTRVCRSSYFYQFSFITTSYLFRRKHGNKYSLTSVMIQSSNNNILVHLSNVYHLRFRGLVIWFNTYKQGGYDVNFKCKNLTFFW